MASATETKTERADLRKTIGVVSSDKANKTIRVSIDFQIRHAKYGKYMKRQTVLLVHDEKNEAKLGDRVEIAECRPISKTKHHRLIRIVEKAPEKVGSEVISAEEVMTGKAPAAR